MSLGLIVIKAVGNCCNLRCRYCYALSGVRQDFMSDRTLKRVIESISVLDPLPIFFWGGGEPLLRRREFFQKVIDLQANFCGGRRFINSFQTNGTLIDRDWIDFFKQYNFQVGISWDGRSDPSRITSNGKTICDKVWSKIELCLEKELNLGLIIVITKQNINSLPEIAKFLYSKGIRNLLYKPYIGEVEDLSLNSADYADAMCRLLDLWWKTKDRNWIIEPVHSFMKILSNNFSEIACQLTNDCGTFLTVESNGDISCCDFVSQRFVFGNIRTISISDVFKKATYRRFVIEAKNKPERCYDCEWNYVCSGGCLHYRKFDIRFQKWGKYFLCEAQKKIFNYCRKQLKKPKKTMA